MSTTSPHRRKAPLRAADGHREADLLARLGHRLLQVCEQVLLALDARRQPHEVVRKPTSLTNLFRDRCVGHEAWERDEGGGGAKGDGDLEELQVLRERTRQLDVARLEGHQRAAARSLTHVKLIVGVVGRAGIVHLGDGWVALEPANHGDAVLLLALHAQRHRLEPAQAQPAVEGREAAALGVLQKVDLLCQLLVAHREDTGGRVRVASDELGGRCHGDVASKREWLLEHRRHNRIVHHRERPRLARHRRDRADVGHLHARIRRGFHPHELRLGTDGTTDGVEVAQVDVAYRHTRSRRNVGQQPRRTAINVVACHDMTSGRHQPQRDCESSHAGGEGEGASCTLKVGHLGLEHLARRVARARVVELAALHHARQLERCRLVQHRAGCVVWVALALTLRVAETRGHVKRSLGGHGSGSTHGAARCHRVQRCQQPVVHRHGACVDGVCHREHLRLTRHGGAGLRLLYTLENGLDVALETLAVSEQLRVEREH
mmetsp:Transcript_27450/g.69856  ORF Transcript_27450/g.69856 Transcript_27450/m.69856 type:complete len:490 (-) Transcript_27450:817-2286(-)